MYKTCSLYSKRPNATLSGLWERILSCILKRTGDTTESRLDEQRKTLSYKTSDKIFQLRPSCTRDELAIRWHPWTRGRGHGDAPSCQSASQKYNPGRAIWPSEWGTAEGIHTPPNHQQPKLYNWETSQEVMHPQCARSIHWTLSWLIPHSFFLQF